MRIKRHMFLTCGFLVAVALPGCQEEEIRQYQAPKMPASVSGPPEESGGGDPHAEGPQRMLAAIFPQSDQTWFFKMTGPAPDVAGEQANFARFIQSIEFGGGNEVNWDVPAGWEVQPSDPSNSMRHATFMLGHAAHPIELTVIPLGPEAADLLPNVNRWRGQLGLQPIGEDELEDVADELEIDGRDVTLVDMTGPGGGSGPVTPPFAGGSSGSSPPEAAPASPSDSASEPESQSSSPLTYTVPEGWTEEAASGMRKASFTINQDGESADVSVISLPGPAGGRLMNVNRWRGQVGLEPIDEQQLEEDIEPIEINGQSAEIIDLPGPESDGDERQRILAAILKRGGDSWFFKMTGSAELVGEQKSVFRAFVESVRFSTEEEEGEGGGNG